MTKMDYFGSKSQTLPALGV